MFSSQIPRMQAPLTSVLGVLVLFSLVSPLTAQDKDADPERLVAEFLSAVDDNSFAKVEKLAREIVARGEDVHEPLMQGLEQRSTNAAVWSLRCLMQLGAALPRETIERMCRNEDATIRAEAVRVGTALLDEAFVPCLMSMVKDADRMVRRRTYDGLLVHAVGRKECLVLMIESLVVVDFWVRSRAARFISRYPKVRPGAADPVVVQTLRSLNKLNRGAAERLFRILEDRRAEKLQDFLEVVLAKGKLDLKVVALESATRLRSRSLEATGMKFSRHPEPRVARVAVKFLKAIKSRRSVRTLVDLIGSARDKELREAVAVALRKITGKSYGYDVERWREFIDRDDRY